MNKMIKQFSTVLAFASAMLFAGSAMAGNVAKIGATEYATLQDAVAAANDGDKVELIDNVVLSGNNYAVVSNTVTVDLCGYTISRSDSVASYRYIFKVGDGKVSGDLTLEDSVGGGKMTGSKNSSRSAIRVDKGSFKMKGGELVGNGFYHGNKPGNIWECAGGGALFVDAGATATICDGAVITDNISTNHASREQLDAFGGAVAVLGKLYIEGGVFSNNWAKTDGGALYAGTNGSQFGEIYINGGTFVGNTIGSSFEKSVVGTGSRGICVISNGVFDVDPTPYLAPGFWASKQGDLWTVMRVRAKIGEDRYTTLRDALDASKDGDVIEMTDTDTLSGDAYSITNNVTLDIAGTNVTIDVEVTVKSGILKIKNSASAAPAMTGSKGKLLINKNIIVKSEGTLDLSVMPFGGDVYGGIDAGAGASLALATGSTSIFYKWNNEMVDSANWMFYNMPAFFKDSKVPDGAIVKIGDKTWTGKSGSGVTQHFVITDEAAYTTIDAIGNIGGVQAPIEIVESYTNVVEALAMAKAGETTYLTKDQGSGEVTKAGTLDLNGNQLTVSSLTLTNDFTIINGVAGQGGVKNVGHIVVTNNATLDMSTLTWGAGGFLPWTKPDESGNIQIKVGSLVKMGTTDGYSPNWMEANNGRFLEGCDVGAKLQIADTVYTKDENGIWRVGDAVATTKLNQGGQVFTESYSTLEDAINAATTYDVVLLTNIVLTSRVVIEKTVTVDLNGYEISRNEASAVANGEIFCVGATAAGNLTIKDSSIGEGSITNGKSTNRGAAINVVKGEFTLKSGKIVNNAYTSGLDDIPAGGAIMVANGAKCTIDGGEIINNSADGSADNVYGGAFGVAGTLFINEGVFSNNTAKADGGFAYGIGSGKIYINGGLFVDNRAAGEANFISLNNSDSKCIISNGWFELDPSEYVAPGLGAVWVEDRQLWTVSNDVAAVCSIGKHIYGSLPSAFVAAKNGDKIVMLATNDAPALSIGKTVTLDLNGFVVAASNGVNITAGVFTLTNNASTAPAMYTSKGMLLVASEIKVADGATLDLSAMPFGGEIYGGIEGDIEGGACLNLAEGATARFYKWNAEMYDSANWMFYNLPEFFKDATVPDGAIVEIGDKTWIGETNTVAKSFNRFVIDGEVAVAFVEALHSISGITDPFRHVESFTNANEALEKADSKVWLTDDTTAGDVAIEGYLDLNGNILTVGDITVSTNLVVSNRVANAGGLKNNGTVTVKDGATLDMSSLTWGQGGFIPVTGKGKLAIKAGSTVKMGSTDGLNPNWMVANNAAFLEDCETGAKLEIGGTMYTKDEDGLWIVDGAIAKVLFEANGSKYYKTYSSLSDAIAAMDASGIATNTVEIMDDVDLDDRVIVGKTVVIDLKGHKISRNSTDYVKNGEAFSVGLSGDDTITGDLTIKDSVGGGTVADCKSYARGAAVVVIKGTFTLESGTIIHNSYYTKGTDSNRGGGAILLAGVKASAFINGGAVVDCAANGKDGVTVYGGAAGVGGTLVINGGVFSNNCAKTAGGALYAFNKGKIIINGGLFVENRSGDDNELSLVELADNGGSCVISNGWFDVCPAAWVAPGRGALWVPERELWTVTGAVCHIDDNYYATLESAFVAATNGNMIVMDGSDVTLAELEVSENIALDLNGNEVIVSGKVSVVSGSLALTNSCSTAPAEDTSSGRFMICAAIEVATNAVLDLSAMPFGGQKYGGIDADPLLASLYLEPGAFAEFYYWGKPTKEGVDSANWMYGNFPTFFKGAAIPVDAYVKIGERYWKGTADRFVRVDENGDVIEKFYTKTTSEHNPIVDPAQPTFTYDESYVTLAGACKTVNSNETVYATAAYTNTFAEALVLDTPFTLEIDGQSLSLDGQPIQVNAEVKIQNAKSKAPEMFTSEGELYIDLEIAVADGATLDLSKMPFGGGQLYGGIGAGAKACVNLADGSTAKFFYWGLATKEEVDTPNWMYWNFPTFFKDSAIPDGATIEIGTLTWTGDSEKNRFVVSNEVAITKVTSQHNPPQTPLDFTYYESFTNLAFALRVSADGNIILTDDTYACDVDREGTLDLNGQELTVTNLIVTEDFVITNGVIGVGALKNIGEVVVTNNAVLDMSQLTWGAGGFTPGPDGQLSIKAGSKVRMGTTDGMTPNWMVKNNPKFLQNCDIGAKLEIGGDCYTKHEDGLWYIDNALVKSLVTRQGQSYYETFAKIENAMVKGSGNPIIAITNFVHPSTVTITNSVVFDLNGFTVGRKNSALFKVGQNTKRLGNLTVKDSVGGGKLANITSTTIGAAVIVNFGEFTLESGEVVGNKYNRSSATSSPACGGAVYVKEGAKATIKDGASVSLNTATGKNDYQSYGGAFGIAGTLVIEGGFFTNNLAKTDGGVIFAYTNAEVYINGGWFVGNSNSTEKSIIALQDNAKCAISNGVFDVNPHDYVVKGRAPHKVGDLWCIVDAVCEIGDRGYDSLTNAFVEVKDGDKVDMLLDHSLGSALSVTNKVTVDVNGVELVIDQPVMVKAKGNLAVTNSLSTAPALYSSEGGMKIGAVITVENKGTLDLSAMPFGYEPYGGIDGIAGGSLTLLSGSTAKFWKWNNEKVDTPNWMFWNYPPFFTGSALPTNATVYIGKTKWTTARTNPDRFVIAYEQAYVLTEGMHNAPGMSGAFKFTESYTAFETAITNGVPADGDTVVRVTLTKKIGFKKSSAKAPAIIPGDKLFTVDCKGYDAVLTNRTLSISTSVFSGEMHKLFINAGAGSAFGAENFDCGDAYMYHWLTTADGKKELRIAKKYYLENGDIDGADMTSITADGREIYNDGRYFPAGSDVNVTWTVDKDHIFGSCMETDMKELGILWANKDLGDIKSSTNDRWTRGVRRMQLDTRERIVIGDPSEMLPIAYATNNWDETVEGAPVTVSVTNIYHNLDLDLVKDMTDNGYFRWKMKTGDFDKYCFTAKTANAEPLDAYVYYATHYQLTLDQAEYPYDGGTICAVTNGVEVDGTIDVLAFEKVQVVAKLATNTWQVASWMCVTNEEGVALGRFLKDVTNLVNVFEMPATNTTIWAEFEVADSYLDKLAGDITNVYDVVTNKIANLKRLTDAEMAAYLLYCETVFTNTVADIRSAQHQYPSLAYGYWKDGHDELVKTWKDARDRSAGKSYDMVIASNYAAIFPDYDEESESFTFEGVAYTNGVNAFRSFRLAYTDETYAPYVTNVHVFGARTIVNEANQLNAWTLDLVAYEFAGEIVEPIVTIAPVDGIELYNITNTLANIEGEGVIVLGVIEGTEGAAEYKDELESVKTSDDVEIVYAGMKPEWEGSDIYIDTYEKVTNVLGVVTVPGLYNPYGSITVLDDSDDANVLVGKLIAENDVVIVNDTKRKMLVAAIEANRNVIISNLFAQGSIYTFEDVIAGKNMTIVNHGHLQARAQATETLSISNTAADTLVGYYTGRNVTLDGVDYAALSNAMITAEEDILLRGKSSITGELALEAPAITNDGVLCWALFGGNKVAHLADFDSIVSTENARYGVVTDKNQKPGVYTLADNAAGADGMEMVVVSFVDMPPAISNIVVNGPEVIVDFENDFRGYTLFVNADNQLQLKVRYACDVTYIEWTEPEYVRKFDIGTPAAAEVYARITNNIVSNPDVLMELDIHNECYFPLFDAILPTETIVMIGGNQIEIHLNDGGTLKCGAGVSKTYGFILTVSGDGDAEVKGNLYAGMTVEQDSLINYFVPVKVVDDLHIGIPIDPANAIAETAVYFGGGLAFEDGKKIVLYPNGYVGALEKIEDGKVVCDEFHGFNEIFCDEYDSNFGWRYAYANRPSDKRDLMPLEVYTYTATDRADAEAIAQFCRVINTNATDYLVKSDNYEAYRSLFEVQVKQVTGVTGGAGDYEIYFHFTAAAKDSILKQLNDAAATIANYVMVRRLGKVGVETKPAVFYAVGTKSATNDVWTTKGWEMGTGSKVEVKFETDDGDGLLYELRATTDPNRETAIKVKKDEE